MATLSTLRTFIVVVETGEIRAAGERLGRTPSAISMTLKQLEEEVGADLFIGDRKSRLTAVGTYVATQAKELLRHHERIGESIAAFARNGVGRVDLACVPSVASIILPEVISRFRRQVPHVEISVRDTDSISVIAAVEKGLVGIGIASIGPANGDITFSHLFSELLGVVCRADNPITALPRPIKWNAIKGQVLLTNHFSAMIDAAESLESQQTAPLAAYTNSAALGMVRAGLGIAVLTRLSMSAADRDLDFIPLEHEMAIRHVGIATRSKESNSPAETLFIATLREVVESVKTGLDLQ